MQILFLETISLNRSTWPGMLELDLELEFAYALTDFPFKTKSLLSLLSVALTSVMAFGLVCLCR